MQSIKAAIEDRTPAGLARPDRRDTSALLVHGFGDGDRGVIGNSPAEVERFFLRDPEGVSTVTSSGPWAARVKEFSKWWRASQVPRSWIGPSGVPRREYRNEVPTDIPHEVAARAFVPYHFGVGRNGKIVQWLPWGVTGAHASGWNHRAVGVCLIRDIKSPRPLPREQANALANLITYSLLRAPGLEVLTHDQARQRQGRKAKGCPGVGIGRTVSWAALRAKNMRNPRR